VVAIAAIAAIALLIVRPVRATGVSQDALEASVGRALQSELTTTCDELRGERWSCVAAPGDAGRGAYAVTVDDWGCWEARSPRAAGAGDQDACISIRDYVDIDIDSEG
jgi:hypothetical protein